MLQGEYEQNNIEPYFTLIGHSHGGNVILEAGNFVENNKDQNFKINRFINLACPIQKETQYFVDYSVFENVYNIYSNVDLIQIGDPQGIKDRSKGKNYPIFSERRFHHNTKVRQAAIKINEIACSHLDFVISTFLKSLPNVIKNMDEFNNSIENNYVIKVRTKSNKIEVK